MQKNNAFRLDYLSSRRSENYTQIVLRRNNLVLKIDLVNDVAPHFGEFGSGSFYSRIDSWRNILSNKLTALGRLEIKDWADLWMIDVAKPFNWKEIFTEAKQKDAGLDPTSPYSLLRAVPKDAFSLIKWALPVEENAFYAGLEQLADDLLYGRDNRLCKQ